MRIATVRRLCRVVAVEFRCRPLIDELALVNEVGDRLVEHAGGEDAGRAEVPLAEEIDIPRVLRFEIRVSDRQIAELERAGGADLPGHMWRQVGVVGASDSARN